MELKINLDTKAVAGQMVNSMVQSLHTSIIVFAQQRFGAMNPQFGHPPPFSNSAAAQAGWPFGQPQYAPFPGHFPPPGHPYAPFGAPPPPYGSQAQPQTPPPPQQPQQRVTEYGRLMDALVADPELIGKVEAVLVKHLEEFAGLTPADKPAA